MLQPREAGGVDGEARHRIQSIYTTTFGHTYLPSHLHVHNSCLEALSNHISQQPKQHKKTQMNK
jgi:hypothetical protein